MRKFKLLFLSSLLLFFSACGTTTERRIDPSRGFDMWDYMSATFDYRVEYDIYENGVNVNTYVENHRMHNDSYERESSDGVTTLYPSRNTILMEEPLQDVTIQRFTSLGERGVFHAPSIQMCSLTRFYDRYKRKGMVFYNVIMVSCMMKNGDNQEYYYGLDEGLVVIYKDDSFNKKEWIKVNETRI